MDYVHTFKMVLVDFVNKFFWHTSAVKEADVRPSSLKRPTTHPKYLFLVEPEVPKPSEYDIRIVYL